MTALLSSATRLFPALGSCCSVVYVLCVYREATVRRMSRGVVCLKLQLLPAAGLTITPWHHIRTDQGAPRDQQTFRMVS